MTPKDKIIKLRNEVTEISNKLKEDFRNYDEPETVKHLNSACQSLDLAILCEMKKKS
ncbi:MAG: hypothetical protein ACOC56_01900 [Atribacterota bacterium]